MGINSPKHIKRPLPLLKDELNIGIIGLGYVGLPLAFELGKIKNFKVIGFDANENRISELNSGFDRTGTLTKIKIEEKTNKLIFTNQVNDLIQCCIFIVCVPTPVDEYKVPNLSALKSATNTIGDILNTKENKSSNKPKYTSVVIYESTVFPGVTEDICCNILEKKINSPLGEKFVLGYSPERVNPGIASQQELTNIIKITSGSDEETRNWVNTFYSLIIKSGTFSASSIKIAESAKIVENIQRDINIALVNELSLLFNSMGIDTNDVIDAASTKWNFIPFRPGLVGGHCIGVDPYYLSYIADKYKIHTELIKSGRRINDNMAGWLARTIAKNYYKESDKINSKTILLLGACFKENCPDVRNSQSIHLVKILQSYGFYVEVVDQLAYEYGNKIVETIDINPTPKNKNGYGLIVCAVAHKEYLGWSKEVWLNLKINEHSILFDVKNVIPRELNPIRL